MVRYLLLISTLALGASLAPLVPAAREVVRWLCAAQAGTIAAFERYLDDLAWHSARGDHSIAAYRDYLRRGPRGQHARACRRPAPRGSGSGPASSGDPSGEAGARQARYAACTLPGVQCRYTARQTPSRPCKRLAVRHVPVTGRL